MEELIKRINEINIILENNTDGIWTFEDGYKLGQFYYEYLNTNPIIDAAENLAHNNPFLLKELSLQLKEDSSKLIDNLEKIKEIDFIKIANEHVRKYSKVADEAAEKWSLTE